MKNKYNISDNFKKLMAEVENPKRPPSKRWWDGVLEYDWQHYEELLDAVFSDLRNIANQYQITLDSAWFKNHIEHLKISVKDYSEQKKFLKELVLLGSKLRTSCEWKIKSLRIVSNAINNSKYVREGMLAGLMKELEDFAKGERAKNNYVDSILIDQIKKYLQTGEVEYPKGFLPDGRPYYKDVEDYLYNSVDFSYLEHDRCSAAQSLAYVVLGKDGKGGWTLSVKECAFVYELLYYCGYVSVEQMQDKNLEIYSEKHKYDVIKEYFGVGGKSNKK